MSARWHKSSSNVSSRDYCLILFDDRANEYKAGFCLDYWQSLAGTPLGVHKMPAGFTWTGRVIVPMPAAAPLAKVELERTRYKGMIETPDTQRFSMKISNPTAPDFEVDIPREMLLSEGAVIESGRDLTAKLGHLSVRDSYSTYGHGGSGKNDRARGLSLSLPIVFTNTDYNVHDATLPSLGVQFEDGRVVRDGTRLRDTLFQNESPFFASCHWQDKPEGMMETAIPAKSTRTLLLVFNVPARMNAEVGLNVQRILLYGKETNVVLPGDGFYGFVCIPDDARERIREIADKGLTNAVNQDNAPAERPATQDLLSGTWQGRVAKFQIEDDGATATVNLISSSIPIYKFSGRLTRSAEGADSKSLKGIVDVVGPDAPRHYSVNANATLDDQDHLRVECADWPVWNNAGKFSGKMPVTETWTRQK
jgi:hypothetical protein